MLLTALLLACTPKTEPTTEPPPEPTPIARPALGPLVDGPAEGMPQSTAHVATLTAFGTEQPLRLQPVLRSGDEIEGVVVGAVTSASGEPMGWPDRIEGDHADPMVCNIIDFAALLEHEDQWFHIAHNECVVGGVTVTPVAFDEAGSVSVSGKPVPVDFSKVGGTTTNCAGDITPWNSFLSSEEYEANARIALPDGTLPPEQVQMATKHKYEWSFLNEQLDYKGAVHPYELGWIPEIRVTDTAGNTRVDKRYSLGRFSHELAVVMPDSRTVYLSDDQYHGGFFLFVADRAGDLSAGTLYAAHWRQESDEAAGLDWVSLGHATDAELEAALRKGLSFDDLFAAEALSEDNTCPTGFVRATTTWGTECLKVKEPVLASRFESRRMAAVLGATTEFSKGEGLGFDPGDGTVGSGRVYFATSKISNGMLEEQTTDRGPGDYRRTEATDHMRLPENRCGIVWELVPGEGTDRDGKAMDSDWVARRAQVAVAGIPEGDACSEASIANPDNITFADPYGWLWIAEDTTKHAADTLWAVDMRSEDRTPMPVLRVDKDSEVTGVHWFDVNGKGYLTVSNQWDHAPYPEIRSVAALLGPFPLPEGAQ